MASGSEDNINSPLWQHVNVLEKRNEGGGNKRFRCNFCNGEFTGSYSRVKAHLLNIGGFGIKKCAKVSVELHKELLSQIEEVDRRNKPVDLPHSHQTLSSASSTTPTGGGYGLPTAPTLPTTYQMMCSSVEVKKRKATGKGPLEQAFNTDARETLTSHIARMFYAGGLPFHFARNPYYLKAFSFAANTNIGGYIPPGYNSLRTILLQKERANVDRMLEPIKQTWAAKGVSIVTDGWTDVQRRPLINFMAVTESGPMFLRAVNCEGEVKDKFFISRLIKEAIIEVGAANVVQVITDNAPVCKAAGQLVEIQFGHIFWTPCVVHTLNLALKNICNPTPPKSYSTYDDDPEKAQVIKERLLNDLWWDKVTYILEFTAPIYDMLRFADTDKPALHLIYEMWDTMIEKVREVIYRHERIVETETSEFYQVVYDILISRWTKSTSPLHCLAHSLNPRYYSQVWLDAGPNRVPPHCDAEISDERNKCLRRFFIDPEERKCANLEFARFSGLLDTFGSYDSLHDRGNIDPHSWWLLYGSSAPKLQKIALKLLCQPCSSSCAERNWSTYSIHSMRRNKILPERAEDLVFIHTNLRLLSRKQEQYNQGESRLWDVCGDKFDPLDGAGELEIATLSLDEPELENDIGSNVENVE